MTHDDDGTTADEVVPDVLVTLTTEDIKTNDDMTVVVPDVLP